MREKARAAFVKADAAEKLSRLNNAVQRKVEQYQAGGLVMLWRQRIRQGKGGWTGPLRALMALNFQDLALHDRVVNHVDLPLEVHLLVHGQAGHFDARYDSLTPQPAQSTQRPYWLPRSAPSLWAPLHGQPVSEGPSGAPSPWAADAWERRRWSAKRSLRDLIRWGSDETT